MFRQPVEIERLYIDFDCFFASVEQQLQPKLRQRPVGVLPFMSEYSCVIAPSREAKQLGVKTGTRVKEARALCPDIEFVPARHDVYVKLHHQIYDSIEHCVHIDRACSIDEVVCNLLGQERRKPVQLAGKIRATLSERIGSHITCSLGFGPNQLLAKIASEIDKPEGLIVWQPGQYIEPLFALELDDIPGIGHSMKHRLQLAGISTIKKLWSMSTETLRKIWGSVEGERFWYSLHGYDVPYIPTNRCMYGHSRILSAEHREPDRARNCARLLTVKAARRLRREQRTAGKFALSIKFQNKKRGGGEAQFPQSYDDHTFLQVLGRLWDHAINNFIAENKQRPRIKQVSVILHDLNSDCSPQADLFDELLAPDSEQKKWNTLTNTMDQIAYKYGSKAVSLGMWDEPKGGYAGGKIAFSRIPSLADF